MSNELIKKIFNRMFKDIEQENSCRSAIFGADAGNAIRKKKRLRRQKIAREILIIFITIMVIDSVQNYFNHDFVSPSTVSPIITFDDQKKVLGEEDIITSNLAENASVSEDYKVKQITVGGKTETESVINDDNTPFKISDVTNELLSSRNKDDVKMIVSWKTSRASISKLEYARSGGEANMIREKEFSYSHTAVIPSLHPSSVYTYSIESQDTSGNEDASEKFVFYTGLPNNSIIDVLENAIRKAFGWAVE